MRRLSNTHLYFTQDHQWVNVNLGYLGLTRHALGTHNPMNLNFKLLVLKSVRLNQESGVLFFEKEELTKFLSPVRGSVLHVNNSWSGHYPELAWTHRVLIDEYSDNLMTFEEYKAYLREES